MNFERKRYRGDVAISFFISRLDRYNIAEVYNIIMIIFCI